MGDGGDAPALVLRALRKSYGTKLAVDGLDLEVPEGSFFGLVGPNGAGKTTTLRMVAGLLRPDAGSVVVDGVDVWADPPPRSGGWGCCPRTSACSSGSPGSIPGSPTRPPAAGRLMATGRLRRGPRRGQPRGRLRPPSR